MWEIKEISTIESLISKMSDCVPPPRRSIKSNERSLIKTTGLLFGFYVDGDNKLIREIQVSIEKLKSQSSYLLTHSGVHITQGIVQFTNEEKVRMLNFKYPGFKFERYSIQDFEDRMSSIINGPKRKNQYGIYQRPIKKTGGRLPYQIDPDYFSKYWNQRNNEEEMTKIRLKREREDYRPYKYDPKTGICIRNDPIESETEIDEPN